ncbi:YkgJ family cysteine cluster protein [Nitrospira sp. NS4]|uniref:YkgJ family cysteine cluster protein n=1 Tax=Nitrospira sp. NS4 TaxID=3414498 RepID=UPI003C2CB6BB
MASTPPLAVLPSTLSQKTSRWFERATAALLGQVPCRAGCCRCCIGPFPITILDRKNIERGLTELSTHRRQAIQERALTQIAGMEAAFPQLAASPFLDHWPDPLIEQLVEQFADLPCPALDSDGRCAIYAFRPLTCRSMGIPSEEDGTVEGACEIQTSLPVIRLSSALRREEEQLAGEEAEQLAAMQREHHVAGEELLLPYAFLPENPALTIDKPS